jgi:hypothetical protein
VVALGATFSSVPAAVHCTLLSQDHPIIAEHTPCS